MLCGFFASAARVLLTKSWYSGVSVPQRQASWLAPYRSEYVPSLPAVKADPPRQHGTGDAANLLI
ncbi:hypothetical protein [Escherichia coli]|uniref:hypothetical protein n=1 Tax=Escherichia coli TaxID=562 RepID=UPI003F4E5421